MTRVDYERHAGAYNAYRRTDHGHLRDLDGIDGALRLVVCEPAAE